MVKKKIDFIKSTKNFKIYIIINKVIQILKEKQTFKVNKYKMKNSLPLFI